MRGNDRHLPISFIDAAILAGGTCLLLLAISVLSEALAAVLGGVALVLIAVRLWFS